MTRQGGVMQDKPTPAEIVAIAEQWIERLARGEDKQGKGILGSEEDGYCCLGVLCLVTGETWMGLANMPLYADPFRGASNQHKAAHVSLALDEKNDWWMMNDIRNMTFRQIAVVAQQKLDEYKQSQEIE